VRTLLQCGKRGQVSFDADQECAARFARGCSIGLIDVGRSRRGAITIVGDALDPASNTVAATKTGRDHAAPASVGAARGKTGPLRSASWRDALSVKGLAIVGLVALLDAARASYFTNAGGFVGTLVKRHIGLDGPLTALHVLSLDTATGIFALFAIAWVTARVPPRGARPYLAVALCVGLACAARTLLVYAQATDYSFQLERILPVGYFAPFIPRSPESDAVLYSTVNRLAVLCGFWSFPTALGTIIGSAYLYFRAEAESAAELASARVATERAKQQTAEARLKRLEAQIEPHFLFNTLANVKRLFQTDAATGATMLANLKRYLFEALPRIRDGEATLGNDLALTEAYLGVQQIRMGERLACTIAVPESLRGFPFPPMVILTLAENAIKHGLAPLPEGGALALAASVKANRLTGRVADTGRGFVGSSGGGTGLANLRARLAMAYGDSAALRLSRNEPRGIVATVEVPVEPVPLTSDA